MGGPGRESGTIMGRPRKLCGRLECRLAGLCMHCLCPRGQCEAVCLTEQEDKRRRCRPCQGRRCTCCPRVADPSAADMQLSREVAPAPALPLAAGHSSVLQPMMPAPCDSSVHPYVLRCLQGQAWGVGLPRSVCNGDIGTVNPPPPMAPLAQPTPAELQLSWGRVGSSVALSAGGPVPVHVSLVQRTAWQGLVETSGMIGADASSRQAAVMAVLACVAHYEEIYRHLCGMGLVSRPFDGLWRMLHHYTFQVRVRRAAVSGPSLGAAVMAGAASVLFGLPCKPELGVTGQVTVSGRLLRVLEADEKVEAARRHGLRRFFGPADNYPRVMARGGGPMGFTDAMRLVAASLDLDCAVNLEPIGGSSVPLHLRRPEGEVEPMHENMWLGTAAGLVLGVPAGGEVAAYRQVVEVGVCAAASPRQARVVLVGGAEAGAVGAVDQAVHWLKLYWTSVPGMRADPSNTEIYVSLPQRPGPRLDSEAMGLEGAVVVALVQAFTGMTHQHQQQQQQGSEAVWVFDDEEDDLVDLPASLEAVWLPAIRGALRSGQVGRLLVPQGVVERLLAGPTEEEAAAASAVVEGVSSVSDLLHRLFGVATVQGPTLRVQFRKGRLSRAPTTDKEGGPPGAVTDDEEVTVALWDDGPSSPFRLCVTTNSKALRFEVPVTADLVQIVSRQEELEEPEAIRRRPRSYTLVITPPPPPAQAEAGAQAGGSGREGYALREDPSVSLEAWLLVMSWVHVGLKRGQKQSGPDLMRAAGLQPNEERDRRQWVRAEKASMDQYVRTVLAKHQAPATAPEAFDASAWLQNLVAR